MTREFLSRRSIAALAVSGLVAVCVVVADAASSHSMSLRDGFTCPSGRRTVIFSGRAPNGEYLQRGQDLNACVSWLAPNSSASAHGGGSARFFCKLGSVPTIPKPAATWYYDDVNLNTGSAATHRDWIAKCAAKGGPSGYVYVADRGGFPRWGDLLPGPGKTAHYLYEAYYDGSSGVVKPAILSAFLALYPTDLQGVAGPTFNLTKGLGTPLAAAAYTATYCKKFALLGFWSGDLGVNDASLAAVVKALNACVPAVPVPTTPPSTTPTTPPTNHAPVATSYTNGICKGKKQDRNLSEHASDVDNNIAYYTIFRTSFRASDFGFTWSANGGYSFTIPATYSGSPLWFDWRVTDSGGLTSGDARETYMVAGLCK